MKQAQKQEEHIVSRHRFTRPQIRIWLPLAMVSLLLICGWLIAPRVGIIEVLALLFLVYVAISALVTVAEISVVDNGLIISRLLLPKRYVPWNAIDRTVVFGYENGQTGLSLEVASIGLYEGLSPLNRLPGLVYGQGLRQTIIITPDALEDYDVLLNTLEEHCAVVHRDFER
jgi:hypothetical protein